MLEAEKYGRCEEERQGQGSARGITHRPISTSKCHDYI